MKGTSDIESKLKLGEAAVLYQRALTLHKKGAHPQECIDLLKQVLKSNPQSLRAQLLLSQLMFPDQKYLSVLSLLHQRIRPRTYLEIGVDKGDSFQLCHENCWAVGVDPNPGSVRIQSNRHRIISQPSASFFSQQASSIIETYFIGNNIDFVFLDGMHHFEALLTDFLAAQQLCHTKSVIAIHDCYPIDESVSHRERLTDFWTGDVWKILPLLRKYHPELSITTVPCWPSGLTLIQNLDPQFVLAKPVEELVEEFIGLTYQDFDRTKTTLLNLDSDVTRVAKPMT